MDDQDNITCCPSSDEVYLSYAQRQVLAAVLVIFMVFGTVGNMLVVSAVILSKKLHHATNMFVLNLSIADLLTCVMLPIMAVAILSEDQFPLPLPACILAAFIFILCIGCSINNLACIAVNRYVMITKSRRTYRKMYGWQRTLFAIILTWLMPMSIVIIPQLTGYIKLGFDKKYSYCSWVLEESSPMFPVVLFVAFVPVQFSLIFWSYVKVFRHIHIHKKRVQHLDVAIAVSAVSGVHVSGVQARQQPKLNNKLQVQVTMNLLVVVCSFLLCLFPYGISMMLPNTDKFIPFAVTLMYSNSCVNPVIYGAKHPQFRVVFRCIIRGKFAEIPQRISCRFFN